MRTVIAALLILIGPASLSAEPLFGETLKDSFTRFYDRHGLDYGAPDFRIAIQVAARRDEPIGRITETCLDQFLQGEQFAVRAMACLLEQEEVERRLGNLD